VRRIVLEVEPSSGRNKMHVKVADPALASGSDEEVLREFKQAALHPQRRIDLFCSLPVEKFDRLRLERLTQDIGLQ
jgi:arsenate reductase